MIGLLLACGSPAPAPSVAPEPPPTTAATAPPPSSAVPPPPEQSPPTEADLHVPVLVLPEDFEHTDIPSVDARVVALEVEESEMQLRAPEFDLPDPAAATAVNEAVAQIMYDAASDGRDDTIQSDCTIHLANEHLVSATCWLRGAGGREGFDFELLEIALAIDGTEVHRVQPEAAVLPTTNLSALATAACEARARQDAESEDDVDEHACEEIAIAFSRHAFVVTGFNWSHEPTQARIPYASLTDQLVATGPLGAMLPTTTPREVTITADQLTDLRLASHCDVRWQLTQPVESLDAVLRTFDGAPDGVPTEWANGTPGPFLMHRACVTDHVALAAEESLARARAVALGGAAERSSAFGIGDVWRGRVTDSLNVRSLGSTSATLLRTLSPGTEIVVATGPVGNDGYSMSNGRRTWLRMRASDTVTGWVASSLVRRVADCARPSFDHFLASLPEPARAEAGHDLLRGLAPTTPAPTRFVVARSLAAGRSWIATGSETDCALEAPTRTLEVADRVEEIRFVPVSRTSTESILAVATSRVAPGEAGFEGVVRWSLYAPGATTPGWTAEALTHPGLDEAQRASVAFGVRSGHDVWHLQITPHGGRPRRVRWDGSTFVDTGAP